MAPEVGFVPLLEFNLHRRPYHSCRRSFWNQWCAYGSLLKGLHLDEPSSLVEMLCFRERAVSLKSQDYHSPASADNRSSKRRPNPRPRTSEATNVRGLLGRSRRPPIRGHTSSLPRHGLLGVGSLKQLPKPVCQQVEGLRQGAELPNPDYRDGSVQVKRWGTQYFHGIDRMIPGNKASG